MAYRDLKNVTRRTDSDKYYVIKHLILLKIQNMMDIKGFFFQLFIDFLIKRQEVELMKMKICQTKN